MGKRYARSRKRASSTSVMPDMTEMRKKFNKLGVTMKEGYTNLKDLSKSGMETVKEGYSTMKKRGKARMETAKDRGKAGMETMKGRYSELKERGKEGLESLKAGSQQQLERVQIQAKNRSDWLKQVRDEKRAALRESYKKYEKVRERNKKRFRLGMIIGFVSALLITPFRGKTVRERIVSNARDIRDTFTR